MVAMEAEDGGSAAENIERWRRRKLGLRHCMGTTREAGF